ncbi:sensor histidine kinase [Flexistipes sp.]|uniref:sensor histidine kinase n=1 Tax=Flexistipes sp. TaxID=3088135 RepID=UPI002E1F26BB|nr:sensor histidine kinase [Flexistipes sp.]
MSKRLAIFISILVTFVLIFSTGVYFYQSKIIIKSELNNQGKLVTNYNYESIDNFLQEIERITHLIYNNKKIHNYLKNNNPTIKVQLENLFLKYCKNIELIQAIRVVDIKGNIKIFMRECENLSGSRNFKKINLQNKAFFQKVQKLQKSEIIFSNFERGKLPETTEFCPAMIRTMIPYFDNNKKTGYLVVNFWGNKIGEVLDYLKENKGYSFIAEVNVNNPDRDGIFLFHPNRYYEFANQFNTQYILDKIYSKKDVETIKNNKSGIIELKNKHNFLAFATVYPYNNTDQRWKVCTVLKGSYFFKNINALRRNFLAVMLLGIFLSILTAAYLSKKLLSPLNEINKAAREYSNGNLHYRIKGTFDNELKGIAETINNMAESLQKHISEIEDNHKKIEILNRLSSIGFLSAGISHELNTPLNSIIITCKILEKELPKENAADVKTIKKEAMRCVEIINSLKTLSPQSQHDFRKEKINLNEVVMTALKFLKANDYIIFSLDINEQASIYGDKRLLQLAISNILMNAVDAVYPEGEIDIYLSENKNKYKLEIIDNGKGMTHEEIENIFTPFYTTKSPKSGLGIGLSLVYKIIREHNAFIYVDSKKDMGTKFTLEFESYDKNNTH